MDKLDTVVVESTAFKDSVLPVLPSIWCFKPFSLSRAVFSCLLRWNTIIFVQDNVKRF